MRLSHIPQYTIQNRNVHISVLNGVLLWDMGQTHCGIYENGLLTYSWYNDLAIAFADMGPSMICTNLFLNQPRVRLGCMATRVRWQLSFFRSANGRQFSTSRANPTWNFHLEWIVATWWRHQMETFSALLAICAGNSPVNSPHKGQRRGALMFLWFASESTVEKTLVRLGIWDAITPHTHYDVTLMKYRGREINCSDEKVRNISNDSVMRW